MSTYRVAPDYSFDNSVALALVHKFSVLHWVPGVNDVVKVAWWISPMKEPVNVAQRNRPIRPKQLSGVREVAALDKSDAISQ